MLLGNPVVRFAVSFCLLGLFAAKVFAAAPATLTVATYNVENYTLANRVADGVYRQDYPKPEAEKAALRAVIRRLNADVLALQEVGGPPYLAELQRDLKGAGLDYPYAAVLEAADDVRHVAVLARVPLKSVVRHTNLTFKYLGGVATVKRGLLEVRLAVGGSEWTVFVVHLKSKLTERPDDPEAALERAGEAEAVRDRVLQLFPDPASAKFLIVGDCNEARDERPVRALLARGKTVIAEWLPATDSRGEGWSYFYKKDGSYTRIDHVLVSPGLRPQVVTARIEDAPETLQASDHRPLVVTLWTE